MLAGFVVAVDPYFVFGSPSWRGFNAARALFDLALVKPYLVRHARPAAVALGSSRVEVGLDPRHPGWADPHVFNFAMPGSTSYEVLLAFLHAQAVGRPLKQAVVGLDFFGYNAFFFADRLQQEARFAGDGVAAFAEFLAGQQRQRGSEDIRNRPVTARAEMPTWNEALYLAVNPDVAAEVARHEFASGRDHYERLGRNERRLGGTTPGEWDEVGYLQANPDVDTDVAQGRFLSGYHHYLAKGMMQGRRGGFQPADWNEAEYLLRNPSARVRVALGTFRTGYVHYVAMGSSQGLLGGFPPADAFETLRLHWPGLNKELFQLKERLNMVLSTHAAYAALATAARQSTPVLLDSSGMRVFRGQEDVLRNLGGIGKLFQQMVQAKSWILWLPSPRLMYCFRRPDARASMFDPFRFMVRRAYAGDVDLRLYVTPLLPAVRQTFIALGLGERYEFWLRELVRINEEEAALAGRQPFPLWDFSDVNTITSEAMPSADDPTPMQWFWEYSHYRKATGDLMLDRIFGYSDPARPPPADFGVRLSAGNIDAHLAQSRAGLATWATGHAELAAQIVQSAQSPDAKSRQAEATCW